MLDPLAMAFIGVGVGIVSLILAPIFLSALLYTIVGATLLGMATTVYISDEAKMNPKLNKNIVYGDIVKGDWNKKNIKNSAGFPKYTSATLINEDEYTNLITRAHLGFRVPPPAIEQSKGKSKWKGVPKILTSVVNKNKEYLEPTYTMKNRITGKIKKFFHERQAFDVCHQPLYEVCRRNITDYEGECMCAFSAKYRTSFLFDRY